MGGHAWLGHSSVRIEGEGVRIYVDPFQLKPKKSPVADLVLVSNPRLGYWSPEDVELVLGAETLVLGPPEVAAPYGDHGRALAPGDEFVHGKATIRAVSAGNVAAGFFPLSRGWLGWLVEIEGTRYYHAGATDLLPGMADLRADVAFLPVSGRYVMGREDAVRAGEMVGAEVKVGTLLPGDRYRRVPGFC